MSDTAPLPKKNTLSSMIEVLKPKPTLRRQVYTNKACSWIPNFRQHVLLADVMFDTLLVDLPKSKNFSTLLTNLELKLYHTLVLHYWTIKKMDLEVHSNWEEIDFVKRLEHSHRMAEFPVDPLLQHALSALTAVRPSITGMGLIVPYIPPVGSCSLRKSIIFHIWKWFSVQTAGNYINVRWTSKHLRS